MTRRELLGRFAGAAVAGAIGSRRAWSQAAVAPQAIDSLPKSAGPADRLYDPSVVQERPPATALDNDPEVRELERRLKCTCGCNLDVYTCRTTDFTCTYSPALHREVLALRAEGKSPDQVVAAFIARYGESILMAPRPEGFNLAGYLVPGAAVALAGLILAAVLARRSRRAVPAPVPPLPPPDAAGPEAGLSLPNPAEDERLRRALAEVED